MAKKNTRGIIFESIHSGLNFLRHVKAKPEVFIYFFRTVAHLILLWLTTTTIAVCPYGHQREEQTGWVALFSPTSRAVEAEKVDLYNT